MHAFLRSLISHPVAASAALVLVTAASTANASNLVVNGGFEQTLTNKSSEFGDRYPSQQVTGWATSGYNFVFTSPADVTGAKAESGPDVELWGLHNGGTDALTSSPDGGNYLALNPVYHAGALTQTIFGLTPDVAATVSFYFGGAQQFHYDGQTTEGLDVSLGGQTLSTQTLTDASHGFTGWKSVSLTFMPTSSSEVLSFLATGSPDGVPPNVLLDGVSVTQTASPVPEPSSLALFGTGIVGLSGLVRNRLKR